MWYHNRVNCCLGSNCTLCSCMFEFNFRLYKTLSCNVNGTGRALTTRELMFCWTTNCSSLRGRGPFLLQVWHIVHWYSQHRQSINTRNHSQAGVVLKRFRSSSSSSSSSTILTSLQWDEFALCSLLCQHIQLKPFMWSKATAGSGSRVTQQAWHTATLTSEPKATGRDPSAVLQCEYHKILLKTVQGFAKSTCVYLSVLCQLLWASITDTARFTLKFVENLVCETCDKALVFKKGNKTGLRLPLELFNKTKQDHDHRSRSFKLMHAAA